MERKYTKVSNELLEALMRTPLSGTDFRFILCILRKTMGFHKPKDWISNSQIVKATSLDRRQISRTRKALILRKIVIQMATKIGIQDNFGLWNTQRSRKVLSSKRSNVIQMETPVIQMDTHKRNTTKENNNIPSSKKRKEKKKVKSLQEQKYMNTTISNLINCFRYKAQEVRGVLPEVAYDKANKRINSLLLREENPYSPSQLEEIFDWYLKSEKCEKFGAEILTALSAHSLNMYQEANKKKSWQYGE